MKVVVTGAAGFIGSNLVDRILAEGQEVTGIDNLSTGLPEFLDDARKSPRFRFVKLDLLDLDALKAAIPEGTEWVLHLAANADVRDGLKHPRKDLEQNTIATWNVLEAMRARGVKNIAFSSTGSVYGEASQIPTPEDCAFPVQTSLYGASKLAAEGLIAAYAEGYGMRANIFRFVSVLGERYTHGHVYDFIRKLREDPSKLPVLGDGTQRKSYVHIGDCVGAILHAMKLPKKGPVEIYNLGTDEYVTVSQSIAEICDEMKLSPKLEFSGGNRGWVGDNPFIWLDAKKLKSTGWSAKVPIREGVRRTVRYLLANPWVFEKRGGAA